MPPTPEKRACEFQSWYHGDTLWDLTSNFWLLGPVSYRDFLVNTYVSIDHIFYTKGVEPLYYDTIINEEILHSSDHNPVYADFRFKSTT